MWNVRAREIPVIMEATGSISKSLTQYLSNTMGKNEIKELQKHHYIWRCTQTAASANVKVQNILRGR